MSARAKIRAGLLVRMGVAGDKAGAQTLDEEVARFKRSKASAVAR